MKVKKGMIIKFYTPNQYDYTDWFDYAAKSGAQAIVDSYQNGMVSCTIVNWDDTLRNMKSGNPNVITDIKTVKPMLYKEN